MFSNFLYYITALLIYITATEGVEQRPVEQAQSSFDAFAMFAVFAVFFIFVTWAQFKILEKRIGNASFERLDRSFNAIVSRQCLLAIAIFAVDLYGLGIADYFAELPVFSSIPTLRAFFLLGLFVCYLAVVWSHAYECHRRLYQTNMSLRSYVRSNISFSVVLAPWFLLSLIMDLVAALPFDYPREMIDSEAGQAVSFIVFLVIIIFVYPFLIRLFWRCKPLERGPDRHRIEALCRKAGIEYTDILTWPIFGGRMITAGVMGPVKKCRYILVTDALLTYLEPEEIDAVIAHEIGHIKKNHLLLYLFFFLGFLLVMNVCETAIWYGIMIFNAYLADWLQTVFDFLTKLGIPDRSVANIVNISFVIAVLLIYFRYIFGYYMRNFERQADTYVYKLFTSSAPLISTFEKIVVSSGQPPDKPNWHHFSISERMDFLGKCEADRSWIIRHDSKVRKSIYAYVAALCILGFAGYELEYNENLVGYRYEIAEKAFLKAAEKETNAWEIFTALGSFYHDNKKYEKAIQAYEKSIALKEDNPWSLNNLAWLYATCEDEAFLNPARAVELARKAAGQLEASQIIDTLAESYFVSGRFDDAVREGKRALDLSKDNREYYKKQLERFKAAAKKADG